MKTELIDVTVLGNDSEMMVGIEGNTLCIRKDNEDVYTLDCSTMAPGWDTVSVSAGRAWLCNSTVYVPVVVKYDSDSDHWRVLTVCFNLNTSLVTVAMRDYIHRVTNVGIDPIADYVLISYTDGVQTIVDEYTIDMVSPYKEVLKTRVVTTTGTQNKCSPILRTDNGDIAMVVINNDVLTTMFRASGSYTSESIITKNVARIISLLSNDDNELIITYLTVRDQNSGGTVMVARIPKDGYELDIIHRFKLASDATLYDVIYENLDKPSLIMSGE